MFTLKHMVRLPKDINSYLDDLYRQTPNLPTVVFDDKLSVKNARHFVRPFSEGMTEMASFDYSGVRILHRAIDTFRQLFVGKADLSLLDRFAQLIDADETRMPLFKHDRFLDGSEWVLRRVTKKSGFHYEFVNNQTGMQIFFLGRFSSYQQLVPNDDAAGLDAYYEPVQGTHLKVQMQSGVLNHRTDEEIKYVLENVANFFLLPGWQYHKGEPHLCVDLQGWSPTIELLDNMFRRSPFEDIHLDAKIDFDAKGVIHGRGFQTITLGEMRGVQLCIYRKDLLTKKKGVFNYWSDIWSANCPDYDPEAPVYRVELRFNSNIVMQMTNSLVAAVLDAEPWKELSDPNLDTMQNMELKFQHEVGLSSFFQIKNYLGSLWRYGLTKIFRYHYDYANDKRTLHPIWSILLQEVNWEGRYIDLKRSYKKPVGERDVEQTEKKNVQFALAHLIALEARNFLDMCSTHSSILEDLEDVVVEFLQKLQNVPSFYTALRCLFQNRSGKYWWENLIEHVKESFRRRIFLAPAV